MKTKNSVAKFRTSRKFIHLNSKIHFHDSIVQECRQNIFCCCCHSLVFAKNWWNLQFTSSTMRNLTICIIKRKWKLLRKSSLFWRYIDVYMLTLLLLLLLHISLYKNSTAVREQVQPTSMFPSFHSLSANVKKETHEDDETFAISIKINMKIAMIEIAIV